MELGKVFIAEGWKKPEGFFDSAWESPHKLRKTFGTQLLDAGFDQNLITSIMGHVEISVTEDHYHYDRKTAEEKQAMLDNILEFKRIANS